MASIVIIAIPNRRKGLLTVVALVWLLPRVDPHVYEQVASFVERLVAPHAPETRSTRIDIHGRTHELRLLADRPLVDIL